MKSNFKLLVFILVLVSMVLASCAQPTQAPTQPPAAEQPAATEAPAAAPGECKDADRVPITWSTIAGFYTDAMAGLVADFEATHCVKVKPKAVYRPGAHYRPQNHEVPS